MLTPYVPYPPSSGGQIRTLNLLKYLSQNHQITLVALYKEDNEKKYVTHLKQYCQKIYLSRRAAKPWQINNIFKTIFSNLPFLTVRNYSQEACEITKMLIQKDKFDVIHAETFYIMPHIPKTHIPILLVEQTIEYKVYEHFINSLPLLIRLPLFFDIVKLKYWEQYYWKKAKIVATVSAADQEIIKKIDSKIKTVVIPNGAGEEMMVKKLTTKNLKKPVVIFQGNFNWLQNIEAANYLVKEINPKLKKLLPNASVIISGQNTTKINHLKNKGVKIIDNPPDDTKTIKEIFKEASVFIAPIFGPGGTRLKILAAMAAGIPVVATPTGVEGLALKNNFHILIAKNPKEFVEKISLIVCQSKLYQKIRNNAYQLIKEKYNWQKIAQKLEMVYHEIKNQ